MRIFSLNALLCYFSQKWANEIEIRNNTTDRERLIFDTGEPRIAPVIVGSEVALMIK